jgi:hypothetical protein
MSKRLTIALAVIASAVAVILVTHTKHATAQAAEPPSEVAPAPAQLVEVALHVATKYGETGPTGIEEASSTFGAARHVLAPNETIPAITDPLTGKPLTESPVAVVTMHGHFTYWGPTPPQEPPPTGTVLTIVVDAESGRVLSENLGTSPPNLHAINSAVTTWEGSSDG